MHHRGYYHLACSRYSPYRSRVLYVSMIVLEYLLWNEMVTYPLIPNLYLAAQLVRWFMRKINTQRLEAENLILETRYSVTGKTSNMTYMHLSRTTSYS